MQNLADAVVEYIDNLDEGQMSAELSHIWQMADSHEWARRNEGEIATLLLEAARGSALDNLPDVAGDPTFGAEQTVSCCKDVAALDHLLDADQHDDGLVNIQAYL